MMSKQNKPFALPFKKLSSKVFIIILMLLILPMYLMFSYLQTSYEDYIRSELSSQIIRNIAKSEEDIYLAFNQMAGVSNAFVLDKELSEALQNPLADQYRRVVAFDDTVNNLLINNLFSLRDMKITLFDTDGRVYANWSMNYNDYSFMLEQDWIKESMANKGHINWSLFSPGFVKGEEKDQRYISLARSILSDSSVGEHIGTIVISINQDEISNILSPYCNSETDFVYVCTGKRAKPIFLLDSVQIITQPELEGLMSQISGKSGNMLCELSGKKYLMNYYAIDKPWTFEGEPLYTLHFTNYQSITDALEGFSKGIDTIMMLFVGILVCIMALVSYMIAKPIRELDKKVEQYTITREVMKPDNGRQDEIGGLGRTFYLMQVKINELFDQLREESEVREEYRFKALRAQVNPHFLFNTLNTIRWMAMMRKADNIVDTIDALGQMLRYSMDRHGELITLGEELEMIKSYAFIQNRRYGEDYRVELEVDEALLGLRVVKFILQPIVENAFIHAFKNCTGLKLIRIGGLRDEEYLRLYVSDNGNGLPQELTVTLQGGQHRDQRKATGIGLSNVNERIRSAYGEIYGLKLESTPGEGTVVRYTLPVIEGGDGLEEANGG